MTRFRNEISFAQSKYIIIIIIRIRVSRQEIKAIQESCRCKALLMSIYCKYHNNILNRYSIILEYYTIDNKVSFTLGSTNLYDLRMFCCKCFNGLKSRDTQLVDFGEYQWIQLHVFSVFSRCRIKYVNYKSIDAYTVCVETK